METDWPLTCRGLLMRLMISTWLMIALLGLIAPLNAQDTLPYEWDTVNISLRYPASWNAPLPGEQNGQPVLELAQVLVDTPADVRPPAIPIITLTYFPASAPADGNLLPFLYAALQNLAVDTPDEPVESDFLGAAAPRLTGTSGDGQFFGVGQVTLVGSGDVLLITGRAVNAQRADFIPVFDALVSSVNARGGETTPEPETDADTPVYGVLWHVQRTQADGAESLLNLVGLALGPNNRLYTYERDLGMVQVDAASGSLVSITPNSNITDPADLAVSSDGTVYVADPTCGCIFSLNPESGWLDQPEGEEPFDPVTNPGVISGFAEGMPTNLAVGAGDQLYAVDLTSASTLTIQVIENGSFTREIILDASLFDPPLLSATPSGSVYVLTRFGELLELSGSEAVSLNTLDPIADSLVDLAVTPEGNLVIATSNEGILVVTPAGEFVDQPGSVVPGFPLPGEMVAPAGVAVDTGGRLYFADSDGTFGALTALSLEVAPTRLGAASLIPDLGVQGVLDARTTQQQWTYPGTAGERVTITAVDNTGLGTLDLRLRLLAPDGTEIAFNDDHTNPDMANFTDAQIVDMALPSSGEYLIVVEQVEGDGTYGLGLSLTRVLTFDSGGVARAEGVLGGELPLNIWEFSGSAAQNYTITLAAENEELDPLLRVFGPDGALIAENDDAEDSTLGRDAQVAGVNLPADGVYRIEAARFDGSGSYTLTIVATS